jgi:hypothetical protein
MDPLRSLSVCAHQVQCTGRMLLLVGVLDKVQQTLSGLAGPCSDSVGNLGLLATEVLPEVGGRDWLFAKPEVLLSEAEGAAVCQSFAG